MPTKHPRVQVTIDDELARVLESLDGSGVSRSQLIRDLALRGAAALAGERRASEAATELLLAIADGDEDLDFGALAEVYAEREARLP